jgi:hypothetical protein
VLVFLTLVLLVQSVAAQQIAPQAPLSPAPVLAIGKDAQDRPIPFGIPPYYTPDTTLGTGLYKAVMATDPSLPEHVLYYPANIDAAAKLPIVSWGNGACIHACNRRLFLTDRQPRLLVLAQDGSRLTRGRTAGNPAVTQPGSASRASGRGPRAVFPAAAAIPVLLRVMRSNADHLKQAIDWATAENGLPAASFAAADTTKIALAASPVAVALPTRLRLIRVNRRRHVHQRFPSDYASDHHPDPPIR